MTETSFLERRVNSLFDKSYEQVRKIFRPAVVVNGMPHQIPDHAFDNFRLGSYIQFGDHTLKAEHETAQAQVAFYDRLLEDFSALPDWIRKHMTLRYRAPQNSHPLSIAIGRTRESDQDVARHSIRLAIEPIGGMYHTKITRVEYEDKRRHELPMPLVNDITVLNRDQYELARQYHYMHLGLSNLYKARTQTTARETPR